MKTTQVLSAILKGLFIGAVFFLMPFFILKVMVFFMITGMLVRMFIRSKIRRFHKWSQQAFADNLYEADDYRNFRNGGFAHKGYQQPKKVIIIH